MCSLIYIDAHIKSYSDPYIGNIIMSHDSKYLLMILILSLCIIRNNAISLKGLSRLTEMNDLRVILFELS